MDNFVLSLDSSEATLEVAGGKGANLSQLFRAGFPVPNGFIISTHAYHSFVQSNGLKEKILDFYSLVSPDEPQSFETASVGIRQVFQFGSFPPVIATAIREAYGDLTGTRVQPKPYLVSEQSQALAVAVRSSATAEDLPGASFAGQQETFLNVKGEEKLLEAVKQCWSSLWTGRAMAYRARQGIEPEKVGLAVIVQILVPADAAGVAFTVNPITGNEDEVFVNSAWGLGEAVVGGWVNPDTLITVKSTGKVIHTETSEKLVMTSLTDDSTTQSSVDSRRRDRLSLTPAQAEELTALARKIERLFGTPQDIEWAVVEGRMYILQARPVTAIASSRMPKFDQTIPGDDNWPFVGRISPQPFDLWTQANVGEVWPRPITPFAWSGIPEMLDQSVRASLIGIESSYIDDIQWASRFYGRVYFNEGALKHILTQELGLPGSFVDTAFGNRGNIDARGGTRLRPIKLLRKMPVLMRMVKNMQGNEQRLEALFPQADRWVDDFLEDDLAPLSDTELLAQLYIWVNRAAVILNLHTTVSSSAMSSFSWLDKLVTRWSKRKDLAHDLVTGLSGVYVAEMGSMLWEMAQTLNEMELTEVVLTNEPLTALNKLHEIPQAQPFLELMDRFLRFHGHRCPDEGEWLRPRWMDAPEQVVEIVAGYLRAGETVNPIEAEFRQRRRREQAVVLVESRLDPIRRSIFRRILARAQQAVRLRDNGRHYVVKVAYPISRIHRTLSRRWVERGWLEKTDDYNFLTVPEIVSIIEAGDPRAVGLDLREIVVKRRAVHEYWFNIAAPDVIDSTGKPIIASSTSINSDSYLQGIAASGGRAKGIARIIHSAAEAAGLKPGDILVTRATDPGWTPVFPLVAALVLEVGGQLSHGAIVAREYGVPAVVNVKDALRLIKERQDITVDGSAGRVYLDNP